MSDKKIDVRFGEEVAAKTVVGGQPTHAGGRTIRIPVGIEKVLYLAAVDAGFREALFADRAAALKRPGVDLLDGEAAILKCIPDEQLQVMISQIDPAAHGRKRFMQKVAACAVALAATTAGVGCTPRSGAGEVKDSGVAVAPVPKTPLMTYKPKTCETENEAGHYLDPKDLGDEHWGWGTGGVRSDRPKMDEVSINHYGDSGQGDIDRTKLNDVIHSAREELMKCLAAPEFKGKDFFGNIDVTLRLRSSGTPAEVLINIDDICEPSLTRCVEDVFKKRKYPKPKSKAAQTTINCFFNKVGQYDQSIKPVVYLSALELDGFEHDRFQPRISFRPEILTACYRKALQKNAALHGDAKFRMMVSAEGTVSEVLALELPEGGEELARQLMPWLGREKLPKPVRAPASVTTTFTFNCPPKVTVDVVIGDCSVTGDLDPERVASILRARLRSIQDCYEIELKRTPGITGQIVIAFGIREDGTVENVVVTKDVLGNSEVVNCVLSRLRHWKFAKPDSGKAAVTVPITFSTRK